MGTHARRVAVVGAGLAGLGAAWRLARQGFDVTLLERAAGPGGRAKSECVEGFTLEAGGALLSSGDRELLEWIVEVGRADELLPLRPVVAAQMHRARVREIDPRSWLGVARIPGVKLRHAARLGRLPRLLARYGARVDARVPERAADLDDRSLYDFGCLYFGRTVLERWMEPLVFAGSLGGARETSRVLFLQRHRAHGGARLGLLRSALTDLPEAAVSSLRAHYDAEVTRLERGGGGALRVTIRPSSHAARGLGGERTLEFGAVVVATAAPDAASLADAVLSSPERDVLAAVRYAPAVALSVALRRPLSAHPQLVQIPRGEGLPLESALLEPGMRGGRVPDGRGLATLRATAAWSEARLAAPDEALEKELLDAFERVSPGVRSALLFRRLFRVPQALPRFGVGRYRAIAKSAHMLAELRREGRRVYFAGDYLMGPSWNAALVSGLRAADAVARDLSGAPSR